MSNIPNFYILLDPGRFMPYLPGRNPKCSDPTIINFDKNALKSYVWVLAKN